MPQPNLYTSPGGTATTGLDSRDIVAGFFPAYEGAMASIWAPRISTVELPSTREVEELAWLGQVPIMREWVGGRHEQVLKKYTHSVRISTYESTLPISVEDLRRDKTGQLRARAASMGTRAATHWDTLLGPLVVAGEAGTQGLAYDGQFYYDVDHAESGTSQTNDLTATEVPSANVADPAVPTPTEAANIIMETTSYMMSYTDDQGEPVNQDAREVTILVTKPAHLAAFQSAIVQTTLAGNVDNPVRGFIQGGWTYRVFYVSRMTAANKVYFFLSGDPSGAAIIRMSMGGVETQLEGAGSHEEFKNNRHVFGVKAVRGVGFGAWLRSALVTLS
jgi:phage major head subunit gpT-like protein